MPRTRWQRLVDLFEEIVTLPPAERPPRLAALVGADADLRTGIERLLAGHEESAGVLEDRELIEALGGEEQATMPSSELPVAPVETAIGSQIGVFRLEEVLGEGGMGVVYRARQEGPIRRDVALKLIRAGLGGREVELRFRAERQALAAMDHPGIARVFEAGTTAAGQPYFAMELAAGAPLTTYCDDKRLTIRQRLELFAEVCDAVQHAHRRGVIHRDLKPSNVLVAEVDGRACPKIIDFGVAKATDPALVEQTLTSARRPIGTPEYMSPEQWEATGDIDTRTDVYSLGVLLYRLLVGALPYASRDSDRLIDLVRRLSTEEPATPKARLASFDRPEEVAAQRRLDVSGLRRELGGDLQWILAKAMARNRDERYDSAAEVAVEVRRYLSHQAIAARPDTLYRLRKLARRHRGALLAVGAVLVALVAGLVATSLALVESQRARVVAEEETAVAEAVSRFLNEDLLAAARVERSQGREVTVREIVDEAVEKLEDFGGPAVVKARIQRSLGTVYHSLGDYGAARQLLAAAHRLNLEQLGPDDPATITTGIELGMVEKYDPQRAGEAEAILVGAVAAAKRVLGPNHPDTVTGVTHLANLYTERGRFDEAVALLQANLAHWRLLDDELRLKVANTEHNLATALLQHGQYAAAIDHQRAALALFEAALGEDHVNTVQARGGLARAYLAAGRYHEAEPLLRQALDGLERILGPEHVATLTLRVNLAGALGRLGHDAEGETLARSALEGLRKTLGPGHVHTLGALRNLGVMVDRQGRSEEAEPMLAEAVTLARSHLPPGHWYLGAFLASRATSLTHLGRFEEAEAALQEGLAILEPAVASDHQVLREALEAAVVLYERWQRPGKAGLYRRRLGPAAAPVKVEPPAG